MTAVHYGMGNGQDRIHASETNAICRNRNIKITKDVKEHISAVVFKN